MEDKNMITIFIGACIIAFLVGFLFCQNINRIKDIKESVDVSVESADLPYAVDGDTIIILQSGHYKLETGWIELK